MKSLISLLCYTTRILYFKYPRTLFPLISALYVVLAVRKRRNCNVKVCAIPEKVFQVLVSRHVSKDFIGDRNSCALVSPSVLERLGVSGSPWLVVRKVRNENVKGELNYCRLIQALPLPEINSEDAIVISEVTLHNIKLTLHITDDSDIYLALSNILDIRWSIKDKDETIYKPGYASKVVVNLLHTVCDVRSDIIDFCLANYFQASRYLHVDDVFVVDVDFYAPRFQYIPGTHTVKQLYFKVTQIEGPKVNSKFHAISNGKCGYFVSKEFTTVRQSVSLHERLPSTSYVLTSNSGAVTSSDYEQFLVPHCPSGLTAYFDELLDLLKPFLVQSWFPQSVNPMFLLCGPKGVGKKNVISSVAKTLGLNLWCVDCLELQGSSPGQTEGKLKFVFTKVKEYLPCILMLKNIEVLCKDKDGNDDDRTSQAFQEEIFEIFSERNSLPSLIVVATTTAAKQSIPSVSPALARMFLHTIYVGSPDQSQREAMLSWILKRENVYVDSDTDMSKIAARCSGFLFSDIEALVSHAVRCRLQNLEHSYEESANNFKTKLALRTSDFDIALDVMHASYSDAIGAPKIPAVSWKDVGGLTSVKEEILKTVTLPLRHPELVASGLRRSGVLLYGPPGTGKTLLAKAVATECSLNFLSVKGPELLNMYVGQSEENVRDVFQRARDASPCIIFFDELDSLAPNRGRSGDSGGVMDRVVSQLLAELDGLHRSTHLFVIGATNRPDLIDPALLRPGRFDKLLYVGTCEDKASQLSVMAALTRKFTFTSDFSLERVVEYLPSNLTGADMYSICSSAWLAAVRRKIQSLQGGENSSENRPDASCPVEVNIQDFQTAVNNLVPSVTPQDLAYFHQLHKTLAVK